MACLVGRLFIAALAGATGLHHHNQTRPATKTIMKLINGNVTAMSVSAVSENPTCF
jgi:hypothetical protein